MSEHLRSIEAEFNPRKIIEPDKLPLLRKVADILKEAGDRAAFRAIGMIGNSNCESEIEQLLMAAFMAEAISQTAWPQPYVLPLRATKKTLQEVMESSEGWLTDMHMDLIVWPQVYLGAFRADFLCVGRAVGKANPLAVECDGHDYHDRSKEQVRRDKARDRIFIAQGVPTMRFAGSEIWKDACACVSEIQKYFYDLEHGRAAA